MILPNALMISGKMEVQQGMEETSWREFPYCGVLFVAG